MWPLLLRQVDFKRVSLGVLIVVVLALAATVKIQRDQLAMAKVVYAHPQVVQSLRIVKIAGPVRIVTRIVERPDSAKETIVVEERGQAVETLGRTSESTPVPLAVALAPANRDRWLCGLGNRNFSYRSLDQYSVWGGREIGPFVVQAGLGHRSIETVLMVRFGNR